MKILFVMEKRVDAGSIHAVTNYVRAGDVLGHTFALYGREESNFPRIRFSTEVNNFDYVLFIIESRLQWMNCLRLAPILSRVPRRYRAILDADGMYNQRITVDGYDHNHLNEQTRRGWLTTFDYLADKILQPTLEPREPGVMPLLFYGYDPAAQMKLTSATPKRFDIVHVGHNWWRWREVSNSLLPAIERIRSQLDGICFVGAWWDAVPPWARALNLEAAFGVDNDQFQRLSIQVKPPVPYTEVIPAMSEGRINIMTQRPLFRHLKILTSKYFEIFCADTIPLVMLDPDHAESVYGAAGRKLALHDEISDTLLDALSEPEKYREIVEEVHLHLVKHHSYESRVQKLVAALAA
jgi:hypothetical protein